MFRSVVAFGVILGTSMSTTTIVDRIDPFAKRSLKKKTKKSQGSSRYRNSQDVELQPLPLLKGKCFVLLITSVCFCYSFLPSYYYQPNGYRYFFIPQIPTYFKLQFNVVDRCTVMSRLSIFDYFQFECAKENGNYKWNHRFLRHVSGFKNTCTGCITFYSGAPYLDVITVRWQINKIKF